MHSDDYNLLFISLLVLGIGPLVYQVARIAGAALAALDGFIFVAIGGLVLLHIVPESIALGGGMAIVAAIVGVVAPGWIEHHLHGRAGQVHSVALVLGLVAIGVHAFMDGMALVSSGHPSEGHTPHMLPMAVILHRLPVGLTIWFLLRPVYGFKMAVMGLVGVAVATVVGGLAGGIIESVMENRGWGVFQALVAGSLLHVILHRSYPLGGGSAAKSRLLAGIGALGGIALLWGIGIEHDADLFMAQAGSDFYWLAKETAPALLLAYTVAGLVYGLLPTASLEWMKKGSAWRQAQRGLAFGLPLPICSCGVVPVYRSLVYQGVPATAGLAFLIATPELSLDAVLISLPLLGEEMTLIRVVAAALVALLVGWGVGRLVPAVKLGQGGEVGWQLEGLSRGTRLKNGMIHGLTEMVETTAPWILLGLGIAALVGPLLQSQWLDEIPAGVDVLIFALLGIPTYVCASGATPLVAVLILKGISPGAALAFLLTGPATNLTTFGILKSLHGRKVALIFGGTIGCLAILLGMLVNLWLPNVSAKAVTPAFHESSMDWHIITLVLVAGLFILALLRRGPRGFISELWTMDEDDGHHDHDHDHDHGCCAETSQNRHVH